MGTEQALEDHLRFLYGRAGGERVAAELERRLDAFRRRHPDLAGRKRRLTERDVFLITYGDQIREPDRPALQSLSEFLQTYLADAFEGVHLLPHFPYSSDDGFSVIDYREVNPELGDWTDVARLGRSHRLMIDGVFNHVSASSAWFQAFRRGEMPYADYFIVVDPKTDLGKVVRPRTHPLLTPFDTAVGRRHVWTTFSDDQIDLNFENPAVLLEIVNVLLFYLEKGAEVIRLDAVAYLWKEIGTPCLHLPQTHAVVKLLRAALDRVAPGVLLITETNVPQPDNFSYFGDGMDEAQMVYNFALPPLVVHTFRTGDTRALATWAAGLTTPSPATTLFNILASHDGIGLVPASGLLHEEEIAALVETTLAHGGRVSFKSNPDGSRSPYELNITLYDALNDPRAPDDPVDVQRFLAAQAIMLSLPGVPAVYIHSLLGSRNDQEGTARAGRDRAINRRKFGRAELERELARPGSLPGRVLHGYRQLLRVRRAHPAFHPQSGRQVLDLSNAVWAQVRGGSLLDLVNVSREAQSVTVDLPAARLPPARLWHDLIGGASFPAERGELTLSLAQYQASWLVPTP